MLGIVDDNGPQLYMIEPTGNFMGYNACACGKGTRNAKNELEKLNFETLSAVDAVKEATRIMVEVQNAVKDKDTELEVSWICEESNWEHRFIPSNLLQESLVYAKNCLDEKMQE